MAFLAYPEGKEPKAQQEIAVQITQEAIKTKLPAVSRSLTLPGRYLVLTLDQPGLRFSHRIGERAALEAFLQDALKENTRDGWIVRTNAAQAEPEELSAEIKSLSEKAERIRAYLAEYGDRA